MKSTFQVVDGHKCRRRIDQPATIELTQTRRPNEGCFVWVGTYLKAVPAPDDRNSRHF